MRGPRQNGVALRSTHPLAPDERRAPREIDWRVELGQRPCSVFPLFKRSQEGGAAIQNCPGRRSRSRLAATVPAFRARGRPQERPGGSLLRPASGGGSRACVMRSGGGGRQTRSCREAPRPTRVERIRLVGPSTKANCLGTSLCGVQAGRAQRPCRRSPLRKALSARGPAQAQDTKRKRRQRRSERQRRQPFDAKGHMINGSPPLDNVG